jgi:hypothetical protein
MTKDEILKLAKQCGFERLGHDDHDYVCYPDEIMAFAKLVAQYEREACAKEAETTFYSVQAAENIRARGQE